MKVNKLELNGEKTVFMIIMSPYYQKQLTRLGLNPVLHIDDLEIQPVENVRNLCEEFLTMKCPWSLRLHT